MKDEYSELDKHKDHKANFLGKFWLVFIVTLPIIGYSEIFNVLFGFYLLPFKGQEMFVLFLGTFVYFYGGWFFIVGAKKELQAGLPGMMTLISIATTTAYVFSVYQTFAGENDVLFWELSTLITIMLLGHLIEKNSLSKAQNALKELTKLLPDTALVVRDGEAITIGIIDLKIGDITLIKPGEKIPADGIIIEGESEINEFIITGESNLIFKTKNDEVIAGSINGDGAIRVKVVKIGENTFLSGIMRLVADAEISKSRLQILSDRAASYLTLIAVASGMLTLDVWLFFQAGTVFAVERMVAVLVIACPHALGLAVPLAASISTTIAARSGFLIRRRLSFEAARNIDIVLFDKTGTLTKGEFGVDKIIPMENETEINVLKLAASANYGSEHPLAKAIIGEAEAKNILFEKIYLPERIPGKGVLAKVGDTEIITGNSHLILDMNIPLPERFWEKMAPFAIQGKTIIYVIENKKLIGGIAFADIIRPESREAIMKIKEMGIKTAMITGDSESVALWVSEELGLNKYFSEVLPQEKAEKIRMLKREGMRVAMVGDGINDAPALMEADLGIAIGAGTNVAIESAGIVLIKNDPRDIPKIIKLSKMTYSIMIQNIFWASAHNIIAIPLAGGLLVSRGFVLEPSLSAILMSLSAIIVTVNSMMLRKIKF